VIKFSSASSPSELRERRWCTSRFCIVPHLWHRQLSRFRTRWRSAVYDSGSSRSGGRLKLVGFVRFIFISQPIAPLQLRTEFASRVSWTGCTPAIHFSPAHPGAPSDPHRELPRGRNNRAEPGGLEPLEFVENPEKGPIEVACLPCHLARSSERTLPRFPAFLLAK